MHRRFSWDALNVTNANTTCGWDKCYFQGKREDEGWLVGRTRVMNNIWDELKHKLKYWSSAWAFAEELRADFGVDHLLRGPPFLATLSPQQAKYSNAKMNAAPGRKRASHNQRDSWHVAGAGGRMALNNYTPPGRIPCKRSARAHGPNAWC